MNKGKVLLTGGMGFIGSHTAVDLIQAGFEVVILDNLYNSKVTVLDKIQQITGKRPEFFEADLRDAAALEQILVGGEFGAVIHFAGLKAVAESVEKPLEYYDANVGGTINLLYAMRKAGVKRLIFSSSATVYGEPTDERCTEKMPTGRDLANPYGRTKYFIEEMLKDVAKSDPEFDITILRYFNPIGAHKSGLLGEDPNGRPNNLMPIVMKVATGEIPELEIFGDDYATVDGTCVRDYIHVVDLARGHGAALRKMKGLKIYNLGTGRGSSVKEIVRAFEKVSKQALPHRIAARRAGDLPALCADVSLAERQLKWRAERDVADAMRDTLRFLKQQSEAQNPPVAAPEETPSGA